MSQYNRNRTLLFECIARFFLNDLFVHTYNLAKSETRGSDSVTDTYVAKIAGYIRVTKTSSTFYRRLLTNLHSYCTRNPAFINNSYSDLINQIVAAFVPQDYFEALSRDQIDEFLSSIICDIVGPLGAICVKPVYLKKIIDERSGVQKEITVAALLKEAMIILDNKRESIIQEFVRSIGQVKDTVPVEQANRLRKALDELTEKNDDLNSYINDLTHKLELKTQRENKLLKLIALLQKKQENILETSTALSAKTKSVAPAPVARRTPIHTPAPSVIMAHGAAPPPLAPPPVLTAETLQQNSKKQMDRESSSEDEAIFVQPDRESVASEQTLSSEKDGDGNIGIIDDLLLQD